MRSVCDLWHGVAVTSYSRRPDIVHAVRQFLIERAAREARAPLPTYSDVADVYGGIPRGTGPVLNSIRRDCELRSEPDLSVLVVDVRSGLPGLLDGHPVESGDPASVQRWHMELGRVRKFQWPVK